VGESEGGSGMSEPKFTKGPWFMEHDREFDECMVYAEREGERVDICEVSTCVTVSNEDNHISMKQIKANAKLLSDAWQLPDLRREIKELKAINKEMYEVLKEHADFTCESCVAIVKNPCDDCLHKIIKVLRKARGEIE
jgi:hypothetical protein